jgi:carboxyl-terminal processing protease
LVRALDVLKYGSVAATPKLPTPKPKLASILSGKSLPDGVTPTVSAPPDNTPPAKAAAHP